MTDTNGNVAVDHLGTYQGVLVSLAILPDLRAAGDEFRASGYTFGLVLPDGGYRSEATQVDEHAHPAAHNINEEMAQRLADVGGSRHGFGRAIDVVSNAPLNVRDRILAKHGFHLWQAWDRNHYEWGNVLEAAALNVIPLTEATNQDEYEDEDEYMNEKPFLIQITNANRSQQWALVYPLSKLWIPIWTITAANGFSTLLAVAGKPGVVEVGKTEWNEFRQQCGLAVDNSVG